MSLFIHNISSIARLKHHFCEDVGEFCRIFTVRFNFCPKNWPDLKALFTFRNWLLDVKSTFLLHLNSPNVSLVLRCESFDALTVLTAFVLFNQSDNLAHSNMFYKTLRLANLSVDNESDCIVRLKIKFVFEI